MDFYIDGSVVSQSSVPCKIRGVLFDLDGVLTDTAEYHFLAWKRLSDEIGVPFSREENERLKGVSRLDSLDLILEMGGLKVDDARRLELAERKNGYYLELLKTMSAKDLLPNARELLNQIREHGIKIGLASASKNAPEVLSRLGIANAFDYIVDPSTLAKGKPDPEIFTRGAAGLGLRSDECIGIEDAEVGIMAIHDAGMRSIGVKVRSENLTPTVSVESLAEVSVDMIVGLGSAA